MHLFEVAKILSLGLAFRVSGMPLVGEILISALRSDDETTRQIAATMIVRAGARARRTLRQAADAEQSLPFVLSMLGDVGDRNDLALLERFAVHPDAQIQVSAKDALRVLHQHEVPA